MELKRLKERWINTTENNEERQIRMWDSRAEEFDKKPIPDKDEHPFLKYMWEKAEPQDFMSALDIGCGAGQYSLALAQYISSTMGTDVSPAMIEAAVKRAGSMGVENAEFTALDWAKADIDSLDWKGAFDIVFAHMTPAICDYHTLDMMNECSRGHCFLVKPSRRTDRILDGALSAIDIAGRRQRADDTVLNTFEYLWLKGFTPEVTVRDEDWVIERTEKEMAAWCEDSAGMYRDVTPQDREKLRQYISAYAADGKVVETVSTKIVTIYWHV